MSSPSPSSSATRELQKSLSKLNLANLQTPPATPQNPATRPKSKKVFDSWDDEEDSEPETEEAKALEKEEPTALLPNPPKSLDDGFSAPPPTPISPSTSAGGKFSSFPADEIFSPTGEPITNTPSSGKSVRDGYRQEKTDAVAKRLIAGALGIRAPKKTEEQREYERAIREKESKRRDAEREEAKRSEEEKGRAKAAVWDD